MGMTVNAMAGMQAASETVSDYSVTAKAAETSEKKASAETEKDAVYEKSAQESAKAPYSINKMSKEDRAALVKQLKADQESRQNSLTNLVSQMLGKQAGMYGIATETIPSGRSLQTEISLWMQQRKHRHRKISPTMDIGA